jgi:PAS domain S-box-containing protein
VFQEISGLMRVAFLNNPVIRAMRRIGNWLIEPSPRLHSPEQRQQAQLLSIIHVILFVFGLTTGVFAYWDQLKASPYDQMVTAVGLGLILIAYGLGRTRRYTISAAFTIVMVSGAVFILAIPDGKTMRTNMLIYLVLPVLLSSVLLPFRYTARLIALQTVGMLAYDFHFHPPGANNWISFVLMVSVMILISTRYLVQRERIRQVLQEQTQAALEAGEQRYRALFDHSLNAFALHAVVTDEQGNVVNYVFLEANRAFEEMTGLSAADIIGKPVTEVLPGIEDTSLIHVYGHVAQTREPVRFEQFFPPLGRYYDIAAFSPQPGQFAALFFDVTARVEAEAALRESEAQYRELFEGVDDAILVHDPEGRILDVNGATCRRLGYTREELLHMKVTDLDEPGDYADGFAERLRQQLADGQLGGINGAHVTKDGRRIDIEVNSKVINYHGQRAVLAVVRDITERKRTERQLRENEARYRAVVEYQTEFIVRWKPDSTRTFVNEAYCRYIGQPREQLVGQKFALTTTDTIRTIIDQLMLSRDGKPVEPDTHRLVKPDGTTGWIEWFDHGIFDENGQLVEVQSVGRDVTERIVMGEQVRQERDRAQQYLDIAGVMLVALNPQGEITLINRKGREILGYAEDELIGRNWFECCLPPATRDDVFTYFQKTIQDNITAFEHYENAIITKSGEERLIAWHNTVLHDAAGNITATLSSGEDVTERRQNEEALRAQRTLAEALRDITALINRTLDPARVFDRILTNLGRVVPHDFADIMMLDDGVAHVVSFHSTVNREIIEADIRKVQLPLSTTANLRHMVETGQPCMVPDTHSYADWADVPETRWVHSYIGAPIRVTGETIGFINVNSVQPYFFTQEHLERLQAFADQAAAAINNARSYDDLERRVIDRTIDLSVRNAVAETLSNTLEIGPMLNGVLRTTVERLGVTGGAIYLIADDDRDATLNLAAHYGIPFDVLSRITGIVSGDTLLNAIGPMPDQSAPPPDTGIFARLSVPIWRQGQIHGVIALVHDQPRSWRSEETRMLDAIGRQIGVALVNARLYAEAVRDEAHIRTILQSVAEGLLVFDQDDSLMLMNPAAEALFAFYPPDSGGAERAAALLWDWLHIQSNPPDEPVEFSLPTTPIAPFEPVRAGEVCPLVDHPALAGRDPHWPCWLLSDVPAGANMRLCPVFERIPRRVLQANSAIVRDADGETIGTVIALHDVTYFHELDELKGRFVATVSHELRTPLSVVLLQVSTLIKYYDRLDDAQRREMVSEIQQQAHVLRELIEDILELSRFDAHRSMPQKQWFDLSGYCDELLQSLEPTLREKHLELSVHQRLVSSYIRADPQQIIRVLRNLLSNAIKYTADGGHITLEMAPAEDHVRLTVADTGIGIAPEEQPYVFDRFYRAERASRMASGTGLGLAITKEIVDLHGGRIEIDSTPGEGSTFTIYLPVYEE